MRAIAGQRNMEEFRCLHKSRLDSGGSNQLKVAANAIGTIPNITMMIAQTDGGDAALRKNLDTILRELPLTVKRVTGGLFDALTDLPLSAKDAVDEKSFQPLARWWDTHRPAVVEARSHAREEASRSKVALYPAGLLFPWPWRKKAVPGGDKKKTNDDIGVSDVLVRMVQFFMASLSPWDFDRREFALSLVQTWQDWQILHGSYEQRRHRRRRENFDQLPFDSWESGDKKAVKVTSTMVPLCGEWKVTGRTPLWHSSDWDGVLFAKAGVFLAGERPPFIGLEADRIWHRRQPEDANKSDQGSKKHHKDSKVKNIVKRSGHRYWAPFVNVNYRSSRMPHVPVVRMSVGIQFGLPVGGIPLSFRFGVRPFESRREWFLHPVPRGNYF